MIPRTAAYDRAIRSGATLVAEAQVLVDGLPDHTLPVLGGSWTLDAKAAVQRRASFTVGAEDLADFVPTHDWRDDRVGLWPIGNEVLLRCGVQYTNGDRELFDCGVYRIAAPTSTRNVDGGVEVAITTYDRARACSRARLSEPLSVSGGRGVTGGLIDTIRYLVALGVPQLDPATFLFDAVDVVPPGVVIAITDDPWKAAQDMAVSIGCDLFFNGSGVPVLRPVRDLVDVDFTYSQAADGVLLGGTRALDDESAFSGVIMVGDNSDLTGPLWAEAWDLNPASPTYYDPVFPTLSKYGRVPANLTSKTIANSLQAEAAAVAALRSVGGLMETVSIEGLVHYAHEGGDVLAIELDDIGIDAVYVVDTVNAPLNPDATMTLGTRARVVS